jgi:hypothetical protein
VLGKLHAPVDGPGTSTGATNPRAKSHILRNRSANPTGSGPSGPKSSRLIFLRGSVLGRACRVLVDCGCSDIVMSSTFARQLGLSLRFDVSLEPVTLANGSQQPVTWTTQAVPFSVGSAYSEDLHFSVTDVTYDIILGLPWLEAGNKTVDWLRRTISFVHADKVVTLEAGKPSKRALREEFGDKLLNSVQMKKLIGKSSLFSKSFLTLLLRLTLTGHLSGNDVNN